MQLTLTNVFHNFLVWTFYLVDLMTLFVVQIPALRNEAFTMDESPVQLPSDERRDRTSTRESLRRVWPEIPCSHVQHALPSVELLLHEYTRDFRALS